MTSISPSRRIFPCIIAMIGFIFFGNTVYDINSRVHCCYFGACTLGEGSLEMLREACYGCGLCIDVCSQESIEMVRR
jgi:NAD-dependent dihydropyrimidine dehydrogenase PreA subunit